MPTRLTLLLCCLPLLGLAQTGMPNADHCFCYNEPPVRVPNSVLIGRYTGNYRDGVPLDSFYLQRTNDSIPVLLWRGYHAELSLTDRTRIDRLIKYVHVLDATRTDQYVETTVHYVAEPDRDPAAPITLTPNGFSDGELVPVLCPAARSRKKMKLLGAALVRAGYLPLGYLAKRYDDELRAAERAFQRDHGLRQCPLSTETLEALDVGFKY